MTCPTPIPSWPCPAPTLVPFLLLSLLHFLLPDTLLVIVCQLPLWLPCWCCCCCYFLCKHNEKLMQHSDCCDLLGFLSQPLCTCHTSTTLSIFSAWLAQFRIEVWSAPGKAQWFTLHSSWRCYLGRGNIACVVSVTLIRSIFGYI